jgi:hypothetical protein
VGGGSLPYPQQLLAAAGHSQQAAELGKPASASPSHLLHRPLNGGSASQQACSFVTRLCCVQPPAAQPPFYTKEGKARRLIDPTAATHTATACAVRAMSSPGLIAHPLPLKIIGGGAPLALPKLPRKPVDACNHIGHPRPPPGILVKDPAGKTSTDIETATSQRPSESPFPQDSAPGPCRQAVCD